MTIVRTQSRKSGKPSEASRQILLVEDQRSLAQMAAKMLYDRWGCHVLIATNLAHVRTILAQGEQQFFAAVSDLNLPDAPNGEVIDELIAARIPVIAMTGMLDEAMHDKIMSKGVVDYVLKDSINSYEYIVDLVGRLFKNVHTKILVVDDSETFCTMLTGMLQIQGLQVLTANDGAAGLKLLEQQRDIKLVLLDYEMPTMDGFDFLLHVRRRLGKDRLAVIGMAGSGNKRMSAQFLKLGANDFIAKPFTYEELVCRVSQNLEMQENLEAIRYVAYHDYLTGLLNRRAFFEQGGKLFGDLSKAGRPLAVAVMDIDFFKKINDSYGHDGGDVALRHFAGLLTSHFKKDLVARLDQHFKPDLVARFGGEEFALLITDPDQAAAQCEAFRQHVEQSSVKFGDTVITFTVSIGIACQLQPNLEAMLRQADENLYKAKETGRNCIVLT